MRLGSLALFVFGVGAPMALATWSCGSNAGDSSTSGDGGPGSGGEGGLADGMVAFADAGFTAPDCPGCTFPPLNAPPCAAGTPAVHVVYPADGVLVPPNMNVISVQWTPFGAPFTEFEVDFENSVTDVRIITKCAAQTMDTSQPPQASGGCELVLDPNMWKVIANQNRGRDPVTITVRGTTDGMCANPSDDKVNLSFAEDDMLGAIYYWKSTVSANGVGGQIWVKSFGDQNPEVQVNTNPNATCNGCHALSRDGIRMVINSDDDDSDDEYGDVNASLIDMTTQTIIGGMGGKGRGNMGPGFASFYPDHTEFVLSHGLGSVQPPSNMMYLYDGTMGTAQTNASNIGASTDVPTMPDWSPDGKNLVYVLPQAVGKWDGNGRNDDDHVFGGSLMLLPYSGNQAFGAPAPLLMSAGENNYYPSFSPDGQLVVFDRAASDTTVSGLTGCKGTAPMMVCPNDSFSNPGARVQVMQPTSGSAVIDLEAANGSPKAAPVPVSNSWPKWSPFLQSYKSDKLLWIAFSSTRDYGLRVRNHLSGSYQCYPADSYEDPGGAHKAPFAASCQQPQLWMAAVDVTKAVSGQVDPSRVGFWLPFQDITTHNHTPQWTQAVASGTGGGGDGGTGTGPCVQPGGNCQANPGGCCQGVCQADGTCGSIIK
jgi:hypothetical protein